jgi:hypothetical protein
MFRVFRTLHGYSEGVDTHSDMMEYTLVVRGPAQDLLYEHFSRLFRGREGVTVVKDRRRAERRRVWNPSASERRRRERRGHGPAWIVPPE